MRKTLLALSVGLGWMFLGVTLNENYQTQADTKPVPIIKGDEPYQVPDTKIVAPTDPVKRGKNVVLSVAPVAKKPVGLSSYSFTWIISPRVDDWFGYPDNSKGSFGTGDSEDPTHYDVALIATYVFVDSDGKNPVLKTVQIDTEVNIKDIAVPKPIPPPPIPTPTPIPEPNKPTDKFGLTKFVTNLVTTAKLPASEAKMLAGSYRAILSKNAGVPYTLRGPLIKDTIDSNNGTLGLLLLKWQPTLDALVAQMVNQKIVSVSDLLQAYSEIANGLEAVK